MRMIVCTAVMAVMMGSAASAQEDAKQKALEAWKSYQKIEAQGSKLVQKAIKELQALKTKEEKDKARKDLTPKIVKLREKLNKVKEQFGEAFAKTDWSSWDAKKHKKLLEIGLPAAAEHATENGKFDTAIKAYEAFVSTFPKSAMATRFQLSIGDLYAIKGDVEAAREKYKSLAEDGSDSIKSYANQRFQLVGKTAPDVDSKEWIGGDATSLAKLKGKVVVVDFWATWCGPCRVVMPGFSKLYEKHKKDGLVVMGLTRFYASGYLPSNPKEMLSGGESVKGMDEKSFLEHVKAFRDNTEIAYPFVIGNADNFKDYLVRGIPTVAVIGVDGKVALLSVGSGSEPMVRAVVEQELKKVK